jgi:hypothetical protein
MGREGARRPNGTPIDIVGNTTLVRLGDRQNGFVRPPGPQFPQAQRLLLSHSRAHSPPILRHPRAPQMHEFGGRDQAEGRDRALARTPANCAQPRKPRPTPGHVPTASFQTRLRREGSAGTAIPSPPIPRKNRCEVSPWPGAPLNQHCGWTIRWGLARENTRIFSTAYRRDGSRRKVARSSHL